jgi:hypothetical protein
VMQLLSVKLNSGPAEASRATRGLVGRSAFRLPEEVRVHYLILFTRTSSKTIFLLYRKDCEHPYPSHYMQSHTQTADFLGCLSN